MATVAAVATAPATSGQTAPAAKTTASWTPAKTSWGHPDIQGVWTGIESKPPSFAALAALAAPVAPPAAGAPPRPVSRNAGNTGAGPEHWYEGQPVVFSAQLKLVDPPDGKLPALTDEGKQRASERARRYNARPGTYEDFVPWDRCITRGVPGSMIPINYNNNYQFIQTPSSVVILYEMIHDARVIPLDGRPRPTTNVRQWMGIPRGRWDGNSLVVETTHFTNKTRVIYGDGDHSEQLRLTERFTPVTADTMRYEFTVEDPGTWTKPWTAVLSLQRGGKQDRLYEYACHEGNLSMSNMLGGARTEERAEQEAKSRPQ
jgi:hypothetical protein